MRRLIRQNPLWIALSFALLGISTSPMVAAAPAPQQAVDETSTAEEQDEVVDENTTESNETQEQATELGTVTVTGSRILRAGYDTLEPAFSIGGDYVKTRGLTNIADALNELPGFGFGATPEGGQSTFGVGVNFLNRFGLGTARTLSLIDGRRVVSSNQPTIFGAAGPGLQVDLNIIPTQLVDRVENLAIGGAPTYGADAIAGVVNVILKHDFQGFEVGAAYGLTERGDNERQNGSILWGENFADGRANLTLSAAFDRSDGVLSTDRDYPSAAPFFGINPTQASFNGLQPGRTPGNDGRYNPNIPFNGTGVDGIPNAVFARDRRLSTLTPGGLLFPVSPVANAPAGLPAAARCVGTATSTNRAGGLLCGFGPNQDTLFQFGPNGNLVTYNPGIPFGNTDASGGDGWNLVETQQLLSDVERNTFNLMGHLDFNDYVTGFMDVLYYDAKTFELVDQNIFNATQFGGLSGAITYRLDDPRLTEQARAALVATGLDPNTGQFRLSRASSDLVQNNGRAESELGRAVLGIKGDFEFADRSFNWEVSANFGRTDSTSYQSVLNQQNFVNAMNVTVNASGQIVCAGAAQPGLVVPGTVTPIADPNCRPLDLFGFQRPSAEARDYVRGIQQVDATLEQRIFNAYISGTAFEIYSGPIPFSLGFEKRKEEGSFSPNDFARLGLGRSAAIGALSGEFDTDEIFAETIIPLVDSSQDMFLLKRLDVTLKGRRVDNSVNGPTNTTTVGLEWSPHDDLVLRGNRTRSLRAPAITELFSPTSPIFSFVTDSCDIRNINSAPPGFQEIRTRNCAAFYSNYGLDPTTWQSNAVSATVMGTNSGDPNLENEIGDALTYGFVYSPSQIPGLRLNADYYDIEITNAIANLGQAAIASGCFDNPNFNAADVPNANPFCSRITRDASGQVTNISTGFVNGGITNFRGISAQIDYGVDLADWNVARGGSMRFATNFFKYYRLETSANNITVDRIDTEVGTGDHQLQYTVGYDDPSGFGLQVQGNYLSAAKFDVNFTPETRDILEVDSQWLYNANLNYRFSDNLLGRLAVTNLFDEEPPFGMSGALAVGFYDLLGRRYTLSMEYKF